MPNFNKNTPLPWVVVWNQTLSEFNNLVKVLRDPMFNYRPISICMHGEQYGPHLMSMVSYSSIWVQRPGPNWEIKTFLPKTQMAAYIYTQAQKGFFPRLIAAYHNNNGEDAYAVVVEEGAPESFVDLKVSEADRPGRFAQRRAEGFYPRACASYSTNFYSNSGAEIKHAFVWEKQPSVGRYWWNGFLGADPNDPNLSQLPLHSYNAQFEALTKGFWRPDYVCPVEGIGGFGRRYFSLWRDEQLNAYSVYPMPVSALMGVLQSLESWRFPIRFQVCGPTNSNQFCVLMVAASDELMPRTMQSEVLSNVPPNPTAPAPFGACDEWVKDKMKTYNIRGAQLAITYQGRLVHASAHTFAEAGYPPGDQHFAHGARQHPEGAHWDGGRARLGPTPA
jgi:hypothetical protein